MKIYRILSALVVALAAGTAFSEDQNLTGTELLISGPVEKVDAALGTVTIFGREISTNKASQLAPGQIVDVYGSLKSDGSMADTEIDPTPQYGSGGDPVFIKGVVTDVNALLGQAQFGGTTVDYTAQLASAEFTSPSVGEVLAVDGTQPLVKGVILASEIGPDVVPRVASVQSRGFASLSTRGGARSSQGIQGGGVGSQGIQGGGVGSQGIQGGGVGSQGIQGGGVGSQGIQGGGVGSQGIQGGGVGSQGIQGGGVGSQGIQGGGVGSQGIQGGGVGSQGIQGGGVGSQGIQGGGVGSQGIQGGGVGSQGIQGGGVGSQGIQGGGVGSQGIQGGGVGSQGIQGGGSNAN